MKRKGLGVSVLFDESLRIWQDNEESLEPIKFNLPPKSELFDRVNKFRSSLNVTAEEICDVEKNNRSGPVTLMVFSQMLQINRIYCWKNISYASSYTS